MSIWKTEMSVSEINEFCRQTMVSHIGIKIIAIGNDYLKASMPVDHRTHRPQGILHGGASVALAETVGSIAAHMCAKPGSHCVGLEINANHIKTMRTGTVFGVARPIHIGRSTQVWDIKITDETDHTVCVARLTVAVLAAAEVSKVASTDEFAQKTNVANKVRLAEGDKSQSGLN